jgi:hypothetical protein
MDYNATPLAASGSAVGAIVPFLPAAEHFYAEHVEADAMHEQVVRREVVAGLLEEEPHLDGDIAFGVDATGRLKDRLADRLLEAWRSGRSSLRTAV